MAELLNEELLESIKTGLNITGNFHDETLKIYISEVKEFMKSGGVSEEMINDKASTGCILRGVADLWKSGGDNVNLSKYFMQRLNQLALGESKNE